MTTALVVVDREHAEISPSSFARVEACTMSVPLSRNAPRRESGPDALKGTAAHRVLEHCLTDGLETLELGWPVSVEVEGQQIELDGETLDGVQMALDYVRTSDLLKGRMIEIEKRLEYAPGRYGFADVVAKDQFPVVVLDYKNGFNVVEADAVQLGLYVLAAFIEMTAGRMPNLLTVGDPVYGVSVVVQPNASEVKIRTHEWTFSALMDLRDRVSAVLNRIKRGDWTYSFGDHCRWCPAAGLCPHLAATARDSALVKIAPTPELVASGEISAATLDEALLLGQRFDDWWKAVKVTAYDYLAHGGALQNAKLDHKRTNRRWIYDNAARLKLVELGVDPYFEPKMITPAEAERRVPKGKHDQLKPLIEKPTGDLALVLGEPSSNGVNVGATLKAALEASVAAGYLAAQPRHAKGQST